MKTFSVEIKWAFIFALVTLIWMVMEKMLGWHGRLIEKHEMYSLFFMIPAILIFALALRQKREEFYDGNMTWAEGFKSGLILSVFIAILSVATQWITYTIISPGYFENAIEHAVSFRDMDEEHARGEYNLKTYLIMAPIFSFFAGFLTSAVVSIFVKRT